MLTLCCSVLSGGYQNPQLILFYFFQIVLIDFGSSREYSKQFTDTYVQIIKSASVNDRQGVMNGSLKLGFLSGYETQVFVLCLTSCRP